MDEFLRLGLRLLKEQGSLLLEKDNQWSIEFSQAKVIIEPMKKLALVFATNGFGQVAAISGPAGSYYFGLLISAPGANAFTFTGIYATNSATAAGRFVRNNVAVPGWVTASGSKG